MPIFSAHYENMSMQNFKVVKKRKFSVEKNDIFLIYAQNIDCGYTLEPPRCVGFSEFPQSMC